MTDYISRDAAEEVFRDARKSLNAQKYDYMANEYLTRDTMLLNAEQIIHALPAADVRPVKKSSFRSFPGGTYSRVPVVVCKSCGYLVPDGTFCYHCGAEMEEQT